MLTVIAQPGALAPVGPGIDAAITAVVKPLKLGITNGARYVFVIVLYMVLISLFTWTWKLLDHGAETDLTWRQQTVDRFIGCPMVLSHPWEAMAVDYMLRLLPALGAGFAITLTFPHFIDGLSFGHASRFPIALETLLLAIIFSLCDLAISYWNRHAFICEFRELAGLPAKEPTGQQAAAQDHS